MWQRLYTHAGGIGGRFVEVENDASSVLSREALADLDDLMKKTDGGFVVRRYGPWVCVITSEVASDAGGRRGVRNHARVAQSDAAELLQVDPPHELERVPRAQLHDLLAAWLATHGKRGRVRVQIDGLTPHTAAIGWAAMPLALQHGAAWGVDTGDGCPVDVVLSAGGGRRVSDVASPQLVDLARRYADRLLDGPREFRAILRNPAITSAGRLADALREAGGRESERWR
ncbi:MAG TPA: hypothetical protein VF111_06570 [Thermoanaerobaculia bacterium]